MTQAISRTTTIGEIVDLHPEAVETLLSYGVHCVGCHVSPFESLEDGFRGHGLSEDEIEDAVKKINNIIEKHNKQASQPAEEAYITISDLAAEKIKAFCEKENKQALRVRVLPGGCSGNTYKYDLADETNQDDITIERNGAKIFIDNNTLQKVNGSEIDYKDSLSGAGFFIKNPQAKSECGCGKSFN